MSFYKYPVKDKHIRIYTEQELNGEAIKTYKHPEGTTRSEEHTSELQSQR